MEAEPYDQWYFPSLWFKFQLLRFHRWKVLTKIPTQSYLVHNYRSIQKSWLPLVIYPKIYLINVLNFYHNISGIPLIVEKISAPGSAQKKIYKKNISVTCLRPDFRSIQKAWLPLLISPKILRPNIWNFHHIISGMFRQCGQFFSFWKLTEDELFQKFQHELFKGAFKKVIFLRS